jgi:NADPH:quinone reductase-like Zn-dependent oxidoreductase
LKALVIHEHGGPEKLRYDEVEEPQLNSPGEVIVQLKAAALNRIDLLNREGLTGTDISLPHILGVDGARVVVEVGEDVTNVKKGDTVCLYPPSGCGRCNFCQAQRDYMCIRIRALGERLKGTYTEYVKLPALNCFPIPADCFLLEAVAIPLVFITVWRMLVTNAALRPGEYLLILGIGGGVATAALQLAGQIGARVIVTSSSDEKLGKAKCLGCHARGQL